MKVNSRSGRFALLTALLVISTSTAAQVVDLNALPDPLKQASRPTLRVTIPTVMWGKIGNAKDWLECLADILPDLKQYVRLICKKRDEGEYHTGDLGDTGVAVTQADSVDLGTRKSAFTSDTGNHTTLDSQQINPNGNWRHDDFYCECMSLAGTLYHEALHSMETSDSGSKTQQKTHALIHYATYILFCEFEAKLQQMGELTLARQRCIFREKSQCVDLWKRYLLKAAGC